MIADNTAAMVILEEDRQAEEILKEFTKGTSVLRADPSADLFSIKNMMSLQSRNICFGMQCLCSKILLRRRCVLSI
jgi:hypothetical protein